MSTFDLDFDISKPRTAPPQRRRLPPRPPQSQPPSASPALERNAQFNWCCAFKNLKTPPLKVIFKIVLLLAIVVLVVAFSIAESVLYTREDHIFEGSCEHRDDYLLCHGSHGCSIRGNCQFSRLIGFSSQTCAGRVQTITLHPQNGNPAQYPAHYLQYKNTSDFIVEGGRVLLYPVKDRSCTATVRAFPGNQFSRKVLSQLQGSILWTSEKIYDKFTVQRNNHTLAVVEEDVALFTTTEYYRLYKLDIACSKKHTGAVTVAGEEAAIQRRTLINVYDFC